ncbi:hypothetical protein K469DRAFT_725557 [Zopfia rhizophila CBS 207.26]|uniref:Aminoglycoside phosphotransferase domain-containing protein n=1 Tax=Zopfia rhizophila CBS 207.26 TaxID=1314779 RepID=A0A6A6E6T3_9PEZI|nr:hypothetical protein K469DRAFT_725557 [Zopfia rhizophila CBS 207.26]
MRALEEPDQQSESLSISEKVGCGPSPYDENVAFHESPFCKKHKAPLFLPSPTEERETRDPAPPVYFPSVGLLVKYGPEVTLVEGQSLLLIRKTLSPVLPVPEMYGWCKDDGQVFIYIELMDSITFEKSWETIVEGQKVSICQQLRHMVNAWRSLKQAFSPPFIIPRLVHVCYGPNQHVQDKPSHPYRSSLPDHVLIVFTHADLHPSNIILSSRSNPHVIAIIDWHQSGW